MALRQIRHLRRPVIHLHVDVHMIIRIPRGIVAVIPQPLQIRRQPARTRTRNQQVTPILKQQRLQTRVHRARRLHLALVRRHRHLCRRGFAQIHIHTIKKRREIHHMLLFQRCKTLSRRRVQRCRQPRVRVFAAILPVVIHRVIRPRNHEQRQTVAIREHQRCLIRLQRTAVRQREQLPFILQPILQRARNRQPVALRHHFCPMRILQLDAARITPWVIRRELARQNPRWMAAKILAPELHAPRLINHSRHAVRQVQIPPVIGCIRMTRQIHEHIPKNLVSPQRVVAARWIYVPRPKAAFIDGQPLPLRPAKDQSAHAPIADGQRLVHGILCRLFEPDHEICSRANLRQSQPSCQRKKTVFHPLTLLQLRPQIKRKLPMIVQTHGGLCLIGGAK